MSKTVEQSAASLPEYSPAVNGNNGNGHYEFDQDEAIHALTEVLVSEIYLELAQRAQEQQADISADIEVLTQGMDPEFRDFLVNGVISDLASKGIEVELESQNELVDEESALNLALDTTYHDDPVQQFMNQAAKYELLTAAKEVELAKKKDKFMPFRDLSNEELAKMPKEVREGKEAFDLLMVSNLRLVAKIARNYQSNGMDVEDLVGFGILGLNRAVELFDWKMGYKFSTYATWWIRQSVRRGINNTAANIRRPAHLGDRHTKVEKFRTRFLTKEGREPTNEEVAQNLGLSLKQVEVVANFPAAKYSLNALVGEEKDSEFGDLLSDVAQRTPEEQAHENIRNRELYDAMQKLEPDERLAITLRFGMGVGAEQGSAEPWDFNQIGKYFGISREGARKKVAAALKKLGESQGLNAAIQSEAV